MSPHLYLIDGRFENRKKKKDIERGQCTPEKEVEVDVLILYSSILDKVVEFSREKK